MEGGSQAQDYGEAIYAKIRYSVSNTFATDCSFSFDFLNSLVGIVNCIKYLDVYLYLWEARSIRGTQQEILRKRPKNNNEAWIKLSEANISILRDCWEKFICFSLLARLMEEFPASKVHIQPVQPDLLGGFPADVCPHFTGQFRCGHSGGMLIGNWVWQTGEIHHFSGWGGGGGGEERFLAISTWQLYSRHEIPSDNLNFLFPSKIFLPGTYYFFQISQPAKRCLKNRYF